MRARPVVAHHPSAACRSSALGLLALGLSATGCFETGYLLQAGEGQLDLLCNARPISHVLEDPDTPPDVLAELSEVPRIKAFGKRFGLVPTKSYESYVELDRPVAVWVVSAAPKLSFESKTWTFPIVGSVPYLGWFDKGRATEHAQSLKAEGWDVDLRGAAAYSTLGFFHDPVLSSMLGDAADGYGDFAGTILHESLHATVYVNGQTSFNEGLATWMAGKYWMNRWGGGELSSFKAAAHDAAANGYTQLTMTACGTTVGDKPYKVWASFFEYLEVTGQKAALVAIAKGADPSGYEAGWKAWLAK